MKLESSAVRALVGAVSGIVATGPMTAAMIGLHRNLPPHERHALPPGQIVDRIAGRLARRMDPEDRAATTIVAHFAYGGATGALYALAAPSLRASPLVKGLVFGGLVWSVSYLGLLPGLRILKPATRHDPRRNALMIAAHLVWGASLGLFFRLLGDEAHRLSEGPARDAH
jgi:uncharacterized membrane protein YagU involved in acid resistance